MIDKYGYRFNVGIILANPVGRLFWGKRLGIKNAWQFPQGGILPEETPNEAMYRELEEELGLVQKDVELLAVSKNWLYYHLPKNLRRYYSKPLCVGQKQKWFLLRLINDENTICLDKTQSPEFESWKWVDYWHPLKQVIEFKRKVYESALNEFESLIMRLGKSEEN